MFLRGLIYLLIAQTVFSLCGFAIHFGLARLFKPELYGTYSVVISILTWVQLFVISGIPVALQKFIAEESKAAYTLKSMAVRIQVVYSFIVFCVVFCFVVL